MTTRVDHKCPQLSKQLQTNHLKMSSTLDHNLSQHFDDLSINGSTPKTTDSKRESTLNDQKRSRSNRKKKSQAAPKEKTFSLSDIAGYDQQMSQLKEMIVKPLERVSNVRKSSLDWCPLQKTVLVFGPSGTGKTAAIKALINEVQQKMFCVHINCSTIMAKTFAISEENLRNIFNTAIEMSPSVVFLDYFDIICSKSKTNDMEKRLMNILAEILDQLPKNLHIIVIFETNKPELIDSHVRRSGRIDIEIEFPVPLPSERHLILKSFLNSINSEVSDEELIDIWQSAHGFTGADLNLLFRKASDSAVIDKRNKITQKDLLLALKNVRPSAMREISLEIPNVFWSDIGGMKTVRDRLTKCVVWPIKHPELFRKLGIEPPKGVLMYGPPGCCKTMIGKALATESGLNFLAIKGPELFNKWVGESERAVREIFRRARAAAPSILFFDEIDALAAERDSSQNTVGNRVLTQMLTEIDGIEKLNQVIIVAATNRPDLIDKAFLRPGRLDSIIYVSLPDFDTRYDIFRIKIAKMSVKFDNSVDESITTLAQLTEGYTGAEISAVCQEAGIIAISEDINCEYVEYKHFLSALETISPRISKRSIDFYEDYEKEFKKVK